MDPLIPRILSLLLLSCSVRAQMAWRQPTLDVLTGVAMTYDAVRGRVIAFGGGRTAYPTSSVMWEWDGSQWTQLTPAVSPSARRGAVMVWDDARQVAVLFGGLGAQNPVLTDTWEWDGATWLPRHPAHLPRTNYGQTMRLAYDRSRARTVLVIGSRHTQIDTWEWDGKDWIEIHSVASPEPRDGFAVAYDASRGRVLLCGGSGVSAYYSDTWKWDGTVWQRTSLTGPVRAFHAMNWDDARQRLVLHGGGGLGTSAKSDTWELDASGWMLRAPGAFTERRTQHSMAYDRRRQRTVAYGGSGTYTAKTREWDGTQWHARESRAPGERLGTDLAFDGVRKRVVLFGGQLPGTNGPVARDTWEWDGARWQEMSPSNAPPARTGHTMVFDSSHGRTIMFGGGNDRSALWEYDGRAWAKRFPQLRPVARQWHAMVYDRARQRVVVFGGLDAQNGAALADTWTWSGDTFRWAEQRVSSGPPARSRCVFEWDDVSSTAVLFGGEDATGKPLGDTWEWDGVSWRERLPATRPPARMQAGLVFDAARARLVLFGGENGGGQLGDVWEWTGTDWIAQSASGPSARRVLAMAWDGAKGRVLLFGGQSHWWLNDTWGYEPTVRAEVVSIGAGCAGNAGVPVLDTVGAPALGDTRFRVCLESARPVAALAVWVSSKPGMVAVPGGCTLYTPPPVIELLGTSSATGTAQIPLPIPNTPALQGITIAAQGVVLDPQGAVLGLVALSQGLIIRVGD